MNKLVRILCYGFYYGLARRLPRSYEFSVLGSFSSWCRRLTARPLFKECGAIFLVERNADFGSGKNVILKDHACVGENARFIGRGVVTIGRHAMMGPDCLLITENHQFGNEAFDGYDVGSITIGDHAWIGARAIILKDVSIGCHAIVGAGAVIARSVPDYSIVVGNPALVVKFRNKMEKKSDS